MTRKVGDMKFNVFKKIIDRIPTLRHASLYFMGEPFFNPDVFKMINYAEKKGIKTTISTNSSLLYPYINEIISSGLSKLILSLDGMTQQTISKYRKHINYENTIKGIELICKEKTKYKKNKPHIKIRFLVFKHNEQEIFKVKNFAKKINVDELALVRPILDWGYRSLPDSSKEWLATDEKYRRYTREGKLKKPLNYCTWIWTPVITWDGNIIPCCYDYDSNILLGNIFEKPFYEIYWSKKYQKIRKKMAMKDLNLCKFCKQIENPEIVKFTYASNYARRL